MAIMQTGTRTPIRTLERLEEPLSPGEFAIEIVGLAAELDDDSEVCGAGTTVVVIADILPLKGSLNLYIVRGI